MFKSFLAFPGPYFRIRKCISSASIRQSASNKNCRTISSICKVLRRSELTITAYHFLMTSFSETWGVILSYTLSILVWSSLLPDFVSSISCLEDFELLQSLTLSSESLNWGPFRKIALLAFFIIRKLLDLRGNYPLHPFFLHHFTCLPVVLP